MSALKKERKQQKRNVEEQGENESRTDTKSSVDYRLRTKDELVGKDRYVYFYGKNSPFSQHHACEFEVDEVKFSCAEQYMMYMKAVTFEDKIRKVEIMAAKQPVEMKRLGRKVRNFDKEVWGKKAEEVVRRGNIAKFSQNDDLRHELFETYPKTLVEASPRDRKWGIGYSGSNEKAWDSKTWRGKNLLGYILTDVRDELMKDDGLID